MKSEMVDLNFKLVFMNKTMIEKDKRIKDLELEVFNLKEKSSQLEVERTQSVMNLSKIEKN